MMTLIITGNQKNALLGMQVESSILANIALPTLLIFIVAGWVFATLMEQLVIVMNQIIAPLLIVVPVGHLQSVFLVREMEPVPVVIEVIVSTEVFAMLPVMVVFAMIHSTIGPVTDAKLLTLVGN